MAERLSANLPVIGMSCANCAAAVERALISKVPGVKSAVVNLALETVAVEYDPDSADLGIIADAIHRAGYRVVLPDAGGPDPEAEQAARDLETLRQRRALGAGLAFTVPLFVLSMSRDFSLLGAWSHAPWFGWLLFALATPVQFYTGAAFYAGAFRAARNRAANMDVLIALGSSAAYFQSIAILIGLSPGGHVYFETSAVIITLVRLGKTLEAAARGRASRAVRGLLGLSPATASVEEEGGGEKQVPAASLRPGEIVVVRPGERIPADGVIVEGRASIDESAMTGENLPADRGPGGRVLGSTMNIDGLLRIKAEAVGSATALAQIAALVRRAQESKAPIQKLADSVSAVFVPAIALAAVTAFAAWMLAEGDLAHAMMRATAVLVAACPCALGLATPTAVMAGSGRGASAGILFRDSGALETAHRVSVVFLDKTGTLTTGKPALSEVVPLGGRPAGEMLFLAASAETGSEHPIARAIVQGASARGVAVEKPGGFVSSAGFGVEADIGGIKVRAGRAEWAFGPVAAGAEEARRLASRGMTVVAVAVDGDPAGLLGVSDELKAGVAESIASLRSLGVEPVLVTGDNEGAAAAVAERAGIGRVHASLMPMQKEALVAAEMARGRVVAMVGDGVNDAPALAAADVGIALGTGTDVAMEASDITLVGGDPAGVARALRLSRAVMRVIRQNLFWAFFYNLTLVPAAAGVFHGLEFLPGIIRDLHPALAAGAMAASSVTVVMNSLRLTRLRL